MSTRSGGGGISQTLRARRGHKERSKNFTELEKRTVLEQIAKNKDVLRQGRSNNATNRSKQLVWSTICEEVNKRCGGDRPRTPAQVKMWYENYKKKYKIRLLDANKQQPQPPANQEGLLDSILYNFGGMRPIDVKDEDAEAATSAEGCSIKDDDLPVNMSNGRLSSNDNDESLPNVFEPQVEIKPHNSPNLRLQNIPLHDYLTEQARLQQTGYFHKNEFPNTPINLTQSHCGEDGKSGDERERLEEKQDTQTATLEERLYFSAKMQHAILEHQAKMKILNMELRQKEEIFSLQKQLFLIELKLKMDFLEKATKS